MFDEIKSVKIKKINNDYNSNSVNENTLNIMSELNEKELTEFFYLVEEGIINYNILPYYFISYSSEKVSYVEEKMEYSFINKLFAQSWDENLLEKDPETLLKMLYGMTILTTDLTVRIRNGLELNNNKKKLFDSQIRKTINILIESAEKNNLYKTLTKIDERDSNVIMEGDYFFEIKNDLLNLSNLVELYKLIHGDYTNKEYLTNNKSESYEQELRLKIKNYFTVELVNSLEYLPLSYSELILSCISGDSNIKKIESNVLDKKNNKKRKNLLESLNNDEVEFEEDNKDNFSNETSEGKVFNAFDKMINGEPRKRKIQEKLEEKPLSSNDLILEIEPRESMSISTIVTRVIIAILLCFSLVGWWLSVKSNNNNDVDHIKNITYEEILSYKLSSGGENQYDLKINRSKGEIGNGTVEQLNKNIQ